MSINTAEFMRAFDASVASVQDEFNERLAAAALQLFGSIVEKTPVDKGRLRNNWFVTLGGQSSETTRHAGPRGTAAIRRAQQALNGYSGGSIYFTNNLPYAFTAEYGGWADGPGTDNGYSIKAPNGMVRISLSEFTSALHAGRR